MIKMDREKKIIEKKQNDTVSSTFQERQMST